MISSTARDLPEHRKQVIDACLRLGMFPKSMEHLPASDSDAVRVSVAMVDEADIYQGLFAHRYGYVPAGSEVSLTEIEYDRAFERGIPRLIFLMHEDHPVRAADVEKGPGAARLEALKARLASEHVITYFKSPEDLRALVIQSLTPYRRSDPSAIHFIGDLPSPPEPYIAYPYTLLHTEALIGRQYELDLLSDWAGRADAETSRAGLLAIVAMGGMGKSALTWKWFHDDAPRRMRPLAGRIWWSFYESDATFENFVARAFAYATRRPVEEVLHLTPGDREASLWSVLDREPYLVVLDGLERLLLAFSHHDATRLGDDELDERAATESENKQRSRSPVPGHAGRHRLRRAADTRVGAFLRRLAAVRSSRILLSSRLYPADLEVATGAPSLGCVAHFLQGLQDDDALALWRAFGVGGSREVLLGLFRTFDNYPLLIRALAGEVAGYRRAPGDFDRWRSDHPHFDPSGVPLVQVKSHVLSCALSGLDTAAIAALRCVAAFRMPASYDTLAAILVGPDRPFPDEVALDGSLTELEDRGLMGWDRRANRYDLHPVVRGVVWGGLDNDSRRRLYGALHAHFSASPRISGDWREVSALEDLADTIELYNVLIGMERFDDAYRLFLSRLHHATLYRLCVSRQRAELLEMLFPDGPDRSPRLTDPRYRARAIFDLAQSYMYAGQPGRSVALFRRSLGAQQALNDRGRAGESLYNLWDATRQCGELRESEAFVLGAMLVARERGDIFKEGEYCLSLALTSAVRGATDIAAAALSRVERMGSFAITPQAEGVGVAYEAQQEVWRGDFSAARSLADRAWELAHDWRMELDFVRAALMQGAASLGLGDLDAAEERFNHALVRARGVNLAEEELQALIGLAELRRRQGDPRASRELLDDAEEPAVRGPYRLLHADALNVLARIERDAGDHLGAIAAATSAYRLAWCNGPPYAYHWGLEEARGQLTDLLAPVPDDLRPFDEGNHQPIPEVEIDPPDELDR
jgi:tetratricopeptide (TPR) repeat protein